MDDERGPRAHVPSMMRRASAQVSPRTCPVSSSRARLWTSSIQACSTSASSLSSRLSINDDTKRARWRTGSFIASSSSFFASSVTPRLCPIWYAVATVASRMTAPDSNEDSPRVPSDTRGQARSHPSTQCHPQDYASRHMASFRRLSRSETDARAIRLVQQRERECDRSSEKREL